MKTARHILLAVILMFLAVACGDSNERLPQQELAGLTMGTTYSVTLVAPPPEIDIETLRGDVEAILLDVEQAMSTYLSDSDLTHFNMSRSIDWFGTSQMLCAAVAGAQSISEYTDGAFDVTVGPLVNLWGFGPDGSVAKPVDKKLIAAAIGTVGHARLRADCTIPALRKSLPELYVDLSAYAKGYAVDRIAEVLDNEGVANFLVEIGGELRLRGSNASSEKWAIAIENPSSEGRSIQSIVSLADTAVATSGDYRNFFEYNGERYSHTIDPRTGSPVSHNGASVTVLADIAATADALATALLVLGPDEGFEFAENEKIAALFLLRAGDEIEERMTTQFAAKIAGGSN
jgi:thiamine biosynthesis lipoprotein